MSQEKASWCPRKGEWGQADHLVQETVTTGVGENDLLDIKLRQGSKVRKCNANGG